MIVVDGGPSGDAIAHEWLPAAERNVAMSENASKGLRARLAVLLALHAVCGVFILWLLFKLVPVYEKVFKDFNEKLPEMTSMVINLSARFSRFWYLLVPALAAGDIAIMLSLNRRGRTGLMTALGVLVWLIEMLLIGLIFVAILVPMNDLVMNLSGSK